MKQIYSTILSEIRDNVLYVILNRPEKRNSLDEIMVSELYEVFMSNADNQQIAGAIIGGAGKAFCAGADLAYLHKLIRKTDKENLDDSIRLKQMYQAIYEFPKPTLCLVNGPAVAGGCGLVTVCDIGFASDKATFGYPEARIGFVASIVSVYLLQRVMLHQAKELLFTGKIIDAAFARRIGLINEIFSEKDLFKEAEKFFKEVKSNSSQAVELTKELFHIHDQNKLSALLDELCRFNVRSRQTEDFKEGLRAFLEKRRPIWSGT
jgi:methylglutaconyl-CoA hydratase